MQNEEEILNNYLKDNNIDKLKIVIGFSLGGNIAFDYFCKNSDKIEKVIIDSAPIFKFPLFVKLYFYNKFKKCLLDIQNNPNSTKEDVLEAANILLGMSTTTETMYEPVAQVQQSQPVQPIQEEMNTQSLNEMI